jgi:(p)ppGpp synthase/HD superfamily hydrolase
MKPETAPPSAAPDGPTLEETIAFAARAHQGQIYPSPGGEPYILHPLRVMLRLEAPLDRIIAVLHDVVEDTAYTLDDLRRRGYPPGVVEAVDRLTRREDEEYMAYIERVAYYPAARRVKLADLADNLSNSQRLPDTDEVRERIARYEAARARLAQIGVG